MGIHAAFQVAWTVGVAVPVAAKASELAHRPSGHAALSIVAVTGIWAVGAGCAWGVRVLALTSCGKWGGRVRRRVRTAGRRREDAR